MRNSQRIFTFPYLVINSDKNNAVLVVSLNLLLKQVCGYACSLARFFSSRDFYSSFGKTFCRNGYFGSPLKRTSMKVKVWKPSGFYPLSYKRRIREEYRCRHPAGLISICLSEHIIRDHFDFFFACITDVNSCIHITILFVFLHIIELYIMLLTTPLNITKAFKYFYIQQMWHYFTS